MVDVIQRVTETFAIQDGPIALTQPQVERWPTKETDRLKSL
ncbi:MAG: hypothetical protein RLZZ09_385 [Pseudomonadota bacterium]|jgi:hypothetical protein